MPPQHLHFVICHQESILFAPSPMIAFRPFFLLTISLVLQSLTTPSIGQEERVILQNEVFQAQSDEQGLSATTLFTWDSRYLSEGRDNLDGEGLFAFALDVQYENFLIGAWLSYSDGADYEERDFFAEYGLETGPLEWYVAYTHLQFPRDMSGHDNEIGAGVAMPEALLGLTPGFGAYYSFEAGGSFMDFTLDRDIQLTDQVRLVPALGVGLNEGYIAEGHDGVNNVTLGLHAYFRLTESIALFAHVAQNWAINSDPAVFADDASLYDSFHGGVGVAFSF